MALIDEMRRQQTANQTGQFSPMGGGQQGAYAPGTRGAELVAAEQQKAQNRAATGTSIMDALKAPFGKGSSPAAPLLTTPANPPASTTQNATDVRLANGSMSTPTTIVGALKQLNPASAFAHQQSAQTPRSPMFDFDTFQPAPGEGAFRNEQTGLVTRLQSEPTGARQQLAEPPRGLVSYMSGPQRQDVRAPVLNPNGGAFSSLVDFANQAGQAVQAIAANKGMRNDRKDALDQQRVGLDAASTLAKIDQGYQSLGIDDRRAGVSERLAGVQADEFGLKRETQGIANRLATQQEQLRSQIAAEQDPAKRKSIVQRLMDFEGKTQQADPYLVVPGGQQIDPVSQRAYSTPASVFNRQTGQWMQAPQGQGAAPAGAVEALRADPKRAAEFDAKYGPGAARAALGG